MSIILNFIWLELIFDPSFSGQLVSTEVLMASELGCPIEMHRIPIKKCDEMYDPECKGDTFMPFHRAIYDKGTGQSPNSPREQVRKFEKDVCDRTMAAKKMGSFLRQNYIPTLKVL